MARDLPDALRLRDIKYSAKVSDAERSATAKALLEASRVAEALDLFLLAGEDEAVARIGRDAVRQGRPVLLLMLRRAGRDVSKADWKTAGDAARADGRVREAYRCYLEANDETALEALAAELPDYELYTPQGK